MLQLEYRDATPEDLPKIVAIYNSTVPSGMVTADTEPIAVESRVRWLEEHNPETRPLWVVESREEGVVGWVSFQSFYGRPAYDATVEISIYLQPEMRGRGLGKQILQYSIDAARGFGVRTLLGFIFAHNEPSLKLFRHFGFDEWANLPGIALLGGVERGLKILGRRISL